MSGSKTAGLLSKQQAARWLNISDRTLQKYCQAGEVTHVRIGGRVLFDLADLQQFVELHKHVSRPAAGIHDSANTPT